MPAFDRELAAPARGSRLVPLALFAAFALFYSLTWSGKYFHDSVAFLRRVEAGELVYYHVAYLPVCQLARGILGRLLGWDAERAMATVSVLAGAGAVSLGYLLGRRATGDARVALVASIAVGLAPVLWFGASPTRSTSSPRWARRRER